METFVSALESRGLKTSLEQIVVVDVLAFVTDAPGAVQGHAPARVLVAVKGAEDLHR